jgi:hypothetical protein
MGMLGREDLLKKEKLVVEKVSLNDTDFTFVTQMTGYERDEFDNGLSKAVLSGKGQVVRYERNLLNFRARLVVATACAEDGKKLFEPGDEEKLGRNLSATSLEKICAVAMKLNNISEEDQEALLKNSKTGPAEEQSSESGPASKEEDSPTPTVGRKV